MDLVPDSVYEFLDELEWGQRSNTDSTNVYKTPILQQKPG